MAQPSAQSLRAWRAFLECHARVTARLAADLEGECGLPLPWYDVLVQLSEAEAGTLRMAELAGAVLLSRSGLTRLVDRMEREGLVERLPDEFDRRGVCVAMTPAGRDALRRSAPVHLAGVERYFAGALSAADARALQDVMTRISSQLPAS